MGESPASLPFTAHSLWQYLRGIRKDRDELEKLKVEATEENAGDAYDDLIYMAAAQISRKCARLQQADINDVRMKCLSVCGESFPELKIRSDGDFVDQFYQCLEQLLAEINLSVCEAKKTTLLSLIELIEDWRVRRKPTSPPANAARISKAAAAVLCYLADISPTVASLDDIEDGAKVSRPTAQKAVKELELAEYASRPLGPNKGASATPAGLAVASKLCTKL